VSTRDNTTLLEQSRHNIGVELARIEDVGCQYEWLVDHLDIYLRRLDGFCDQLGKQPRDFVESSIFAISKLLQPILKEFYTNKN